MNNYKLNIDWSPKDNAFIATCPEFEGLAVVADSREEALKDAEEALQAYIEIYQADGRPLPKPETVQEYSGQIRLRLPRSLHQQASRLAEREGVSLNTFLISSLSTAVGAHNLYDRIAERLENKKVQITAANIASRVLEGIQIQTTNSAGLLDIIMKAETTSTARV